MIIAEDQIECSLCEGIIEEGEECIMIASSKLESVLFGAGPEYRHIDCHEAQP